MKIFKKLIDAYYDRKYRLLDRKIDLMSTKERAEYMIKKFGTVEPTCEVCGELGCPTSYDKCWDCIEKEKKDV